MHRLVSDGYEITDLLLMPGWRRTRERRTLWVSSTLSWCQGHATLRSRSQSDSARLMGADSCARSRTPIYEARKCKSLLPIVIFGSNSFSKFEWLHTSSVVPQFPFSDVSYVSNTSISIIRKKRRRKNKRKTCFILTSKTIYKARSLARHLETK